MFLFLLFFLLFFEECHVRLSAYWNCNFPMTPHIRLLLDHPVGALVFQYICNTLPVRYDNLIFPCHFKMVEVGT